MLQSTLNREQCWGRTNVDASYPGTYDGSDQGHQGPAYDKPPQTSIIGETSVV